MSITIILSINIEIWSTTFFKLLAYSNDLKEKKKLFETEDPEGSKVFSEFLIIIENNYHYSKKHEYIKLGRDFLDNQITADDFSYSFMAIYEGLNRELGLMQIEESLDLVHFIVKPGYYELGRLLAGIYGSCDCFNPDPNFSLAPGFPMSSEKELKDYAKKLLFNLNLYDLNLHINICT